MRAAQMTRGRMIRAINWLALGTALACNNQAREHRPQPTASSTVSATPLAKPSSAAAPLAAPTFKIDKVSTKAEFGGLRASELLIPPAEGVTVIQYLEVVGSGRSMFRASDAGAFVPRGLAVKLSLPKGVSGENGVRSTVRGITWEEAPGTGKQKGEKAKIIVKADVQHNATPGPRDMTLTTDDGKEITTLKGAITLGKPARVKEPLNGARIPCDHPVWYKPCIGEYTYRRAH